MGLSWSRMHFCARSSRHNATASASARLTHSHRAPCLSLTSTRRFPPFQVRAEMEKEASVRIQEALDEKEGAVGAALAQAAEREEALKEEWYA